MYPADARLIESLDLKVREDMLNWRIRCMYLKNADKT